MQNRSINWRLGLYTLCAVSLLLSGCATSFIRLYAVSGWSDKQGIYPATKLDAELLAYVPDAWKEESKFDIILEVPFVLLDFPFSLTFDTLLLPYDLYISSQDRKYVLFDTIYKDYWYPDYWYTKDHCKRFTFQKASEVLTDYRVNERGEYADSGPDNYPVIIKKVWY